MLTLNFAQVEQGIMIKKFNRQLGNMDHMLQYICHVTNFSIIKIKKIEKI